MSTCASLAAPPASTRLVSACSVGLATLGSLRTASEPLSPAGPFISSAVAAPSAPSEASAIFTPRGTRGPVRSAAASASFFGRSVSTRERGVAGFF